MNDKLNLLMLNKIFEEHKFYIRKKSLEEIRKYNPAIGIDVSKTNNEIFILIVKNISGIRFKT